MLSSQLHATTDVLPVAGLDRLAEHLPLAWIEQALSVTGQPVYGEGDCRLSKWSGW
jgi:hypothetical protein